MSITYFGNGQSDVAMIGVVVEKDYTGATQGNSYTVDEMSIQVLSVPKIFRR